MTLLSDDQSEVDRLAAAVPSVIDALIALDPYDKQFFQAHECRESLQSLAEHGMYNWERHVNRVRQTIQAFETRPFGPWIWVELLGAVPNHMRTVVEAIYQAGAIFKDNYMPAARAAIRATIPARSLLFDRLRRDGHLTVDELLDALGDWPLRAVAEQLLASQVADVKAKLHARLDNATTGEHEAIIRLLRRVDAHVDHTGASSSSNLAELEGRLRADPFDVATAQVWADHLQDQDDPRGALMALDLAIASATRDRMLELSATRAELVAKYRKLMFGKPGGWPFRDKYLGRTFLVFGTTWRAMLRGKPETVRDKVLGFLEQCTNCTEPGDTELMVNASFKLVWPGTKLVLPYQEDGHYPEAFGGSSISVKLSEGKLVLGLRFPFERFDDPGFLEVHRAIGDTLNKSTLTATGFSTATPTVDGKKMKFKGARFNGR